MTQSHPRDLQELLEAASDLAAARHQKPGTAHVLLALLLRGGRAADLLFERGLSEGTVRTAIKVVGDEPRDSLVNAQEHAARIARDCGDAQPGPLHVLVALGRQPDCAAFRALSEGGCNVPALRNAALATIAGARWPRRAQAGKAAAERTSPISDDRVQVPQPPARKPSGPLLRGRGLELPPLEPRTAPRMTPTPPARPSSSGSEPAGPKASKSKPRPPLRPLSVPPSSAVGRAQPAADDLDLDAKQFPWLCSLGRNLSIAAASGKLDPLVGRARELEHVLDVLAKRRANNPCLVGPPGVGKTAIVEGLAQRLTSSSDRSGPRVVVELPMGDVLAGTHLRGSLSERLVGIRKEVEQAAGRVIVFFDEIHALVGAAGDDSDAANDLKSALQRGSLQCVGATTPEEYRKHFESDPALARRFARIDVEEPSLEDATRIVQGVLSRYAEHHGVVYSTDAAEVAVRWSARYVVDRKLPDKAVGVLDLAGARARRRKLRRVGPTEIAQVVSDLAQVPAERLLCSDADRLLSLESHLANQIVGHKTAIERVASTMRRNAAGFRSRRPVGSFLFLGPTGVGKTEMARAIASFLFPGGAATTRLDMSEYAEPHALARLIGAPPGYVGHEDGGQLTEALRRRPYQLVLLDEIEKAHRDVLQSLLQVLEEGRLTDGRGRSVEFGNAVVVMTSNLGGEVAISGPSGRIGFGPSRTAPEEAGRTSIEAAKRALPIELWNRIDEVLFFAPLTRDEVAKVAALLLGRTARSLSEEHGATLGFDDTAIQALIESGGWDRELGARPMRRTIQRLVEGPVAEAILSGRLRRGGHVALRAAAGGLAVEVVPSSQRGTRAPAVV